MDKYSLLIHDVNENQYHTLINDNNSDKVMNRAEEITKVLEIVDTKNDYNIIVKDVYDVVYYRG